MDTMLLIYLLNTNVECVKLEIMASKKTCVNQSVWWIFLKKKALPKLALTSTNKELEK